MKEQGATDRVALQSDSAFVRNARPAMLYLGGVSCFALIVFGALIVWTRPESLPDFVDLTAAIAMPLDALLMAGGVYATGALPTRRFQRERNCRRFSI